MYKRSLCNPVFLGVLIITLASVAAAGPVSCATTPSDPSCAPAMLMTYTVQGQGLVHFTPGGPPAYTNGSWLIDFKPQTFSGLLFTGGEAATAPDPFVGFSFGVINNSSHSMLFTYDFVTPYGGGPFGQARSIYADVLIDTLFVGTSKVTPSGDPYIMESYVNGLLIPGLGRGTGCTTVIFVCQSGSIGLVQVGYLSPASGTLEVKGAFTLTPGAQFTLTGRTELVPEPGSLMLFGSGVLGVAGLIRRKLVR